MDGRKFYLTELIEGKRTRFIIPVYQRNYDWKTEHCARLFDDLVSVVKDGHSEHFFGSVVSQTPRGERVIIDGQQRITTVFLLLAALKHQIEKGVVTSEDEDLADVINGDYLIDTRHPKDLKLRLKLIKNDSKAFDSVLSGDDEKLMRESNVAQNYMYFRERIANMPITADELYDAIQKLCIIDITLDEKDDAQLIFESLNSTGLDLSEGDKIRNYILMNLDPDTQETYYEDYWNPIEENTGYEVSDFVRFYLAAKEGKTPAMKKVYGAFQEYAKSAYAGTEDEPERIQTKGLLGNLLRYSAHYRTCQHPDTGDVALDRVMRRLSLLDVSVLYPYLFNLFEYRAEGKVTNSETTEILKAIEAFLFRRWVCGVPTNALNKIFETLHSDALKGLGAGATYSEIVKYLLLHKTGTGRYPGDEEFLAALDERDFYRIGNRKLYLYDRLENGDSDERIRVVEGLQEESYSVEHIMPQTLSTKWKDALGTEDWERVHETWKDRLANLTLTAYNSEYSNRDFLQKRDMKDGFKDSGFRMNKWISEQEVWTEEQLKERNEQLHERFLELWPMSTTSFVPVKVLPDYEVLDEESEFTNRRISAFTFLGERYPVKQWNNMEEVLFKAIYELEPAIFHALVELDNGYPSTAFRADAAPGFSQIADGVYARTSTSTSFKIDLLRQVLKLCNIDYSEVTFELPVADEEDIWS